MKSNFQKTIYLNKEQTNSKNEAPVICRISAYKTKPKKFSFGFKVNVDRWESTDGFTKSKIRYTSDELEIKTKIDDVVGKMYKYASRMDEEGKVYSSEMVYEAVMNPVKKSDKTLFEVMDLHKTDYYYHVNIGDKKERSYKHFSELRRYLTMYLNDEMKQSDILIELVNDEFQKKFHGFISKKVCKNSASKLMVYFRCIFKFATAKKYFTGEITKYDLNFDKIKKVALTIPELLAFSEFETDRESLQITKDIFLFNVVSGYSWTDLSEITYDMIAECKHGLYIDTSRNKTNEDEIVPLTNEAIELINKYRSHPECMASGLIFPFKSIPTMIGHLKTIADKVGIKKNLSTKIARNTYFTLGFNLGMSVQILSIMGGHSNIKQTLEYTTTYIDSRFENMDKLNGVLNLKKESVLKVA